MVGHMVAAGRVVVVAGRIAASMEADRSLAVGRKLAADDCSSPERPADRHRHWEEPGCRVDRAGDSRWRCYPLRVERVDREEEEVCLAVVELRGWI